MTRHLAELIVHEDIGKNGQVLFLGDRFRAPQEVLPIRVVGEDREPNEKSGRFLITENSPGGLVIAGDAVTPGMSPGVTVFVKGQRCGFEPPSTFSRLLKNHF